MNKATAAAASAALLALALVGCTIAAPQPVLSSPSAAPDEGSLAGAADTPNALELADGSRVLVGASERGGVTLARISGKIVSIGTSCWGFEDERGVHALAVDHGSTVGSDGLSVVTPNGMRIAVGDEVSGGSGGGVRGTGREEQWRSALPDCLEGRGVYPVYVDTVTPPAQR